MNNVVSLRRLKPESDSLIEAPLMSQKMFRTALVRMLNHARQQGLTDTTLTLDLTLTALDADYDRRRS
ncbi:hypothetical protein A6A05_13330 [Magnetospirillum moscoviense]|uniref:Uncharacterized protein n=1 Tax=Magnetospirillum moscoviense TaxID=1437059 RepID=A0A178MLP5_9PROT|nr:hypothetical protein A6A05_13330 [Magnetospirillum moscoviense]